MQRGARRGRKKEANSEKSDWASELRTDQLWPVLVADDERSLRTALSRELEVEYEVIAVPGVEEALEILGQRLDFVAVVSDLVMRGPDDGYVLLEAVRLLMPRCARVLVSGTAEGDWFVRNGTAHRFVGKPWVPGAVLAVVREQVGSFAESA